MSDALERVRRCLAASEERDYDHISVNVDESDLRAVCAELTALREARSWERWAIVDDALPQYVNVRHGESTRTDARLLAGVGERVIRVRITEIPEDGQ